MESITNYRTFEDDKKSIDDKISMLERYILAEDKENFFNTLVYNSDTYLYMKLNDTINKGRDISEVLQGSMTTYFEEVANSLKLEILFKELANKIPREEDPEKRKAMIQRFNQEFLYLHFNYPKPAEVKKSEGITSANDVVYQSAISSEDEKKWNLDSCFKQYLETPVNQTPNLSVFKPTSYIFLDLKKIADKNEDHFINVLKSLPHFFNYPDICDILEAFYKKRIEKRPTFQFPHSIFSKMSLEQLDLLVTKLPKLMTDVAFINLYFPKKFEALSTTTVAEERLKLLKQVLVWCAQLPKEMNGLYYDVLKEALSLGLANKTYDLELYQKLVDLAITTQSYMFNEALVEDCKAKKLVIAAGNWAPVHNFKRTLWRTEEEIVTAFLEAEFEKKSYEEFLSTFREAWLKKKYFTFKLQKGEKFSNVTDIFTEIELNTLRDKKELSVTPETKLQFKADEEVKISIRMKNIQKLQMNIYEIDSFNYYKKMQSKIDANIKLAGVIPSWTVSTEFCHPPISVFEENFFFEQIQKTRRGVFVIEFVGDGLSTRALIRKGNLNLVRDSGNEGHEFFILDEENQICKGKSAKLLLSGKSYEADDSGKIFVPYFNENISQNAIISYESHSELVSVTLNRTDIVFDASIIFNEESIESGRNASFIIQPKLFAFNRLVAISLFKDVKVIITSKNLQDVRHSKIVEDVKFQENEDFIVDYLIPSKTTEITIEIKGSVLNKATGQEVKLNNSRVISINRRDSQEVFYDVFLKQEKTGYKVRLLGKNGEPYSGYLLQFTLNTNYLNTAPSYTLETDQNGEIFLGHLNGVWSVTASMVTAPGSYRGIKKTWMIDTLERFKNFPEDFDIVEGEDLCLPAYGESVTAEDYSLFRTDQLYDNIYENSFKSIQREGELLYLSGLKEGYYVFYYNKLRDGKKVTLRVHKGTRWGANQNYLLKEKQMIKMMNQANYLTYTQLKLTEKELEMKVLSNEMDTVKVHVLAYNHFPDHIKSIVDSLKGNCLVEKAEITNFAQNFCEYYSEKELSDELKYVLERKTRPTFMGNTLEKPSGLLKRHFKQKTKADREVLGKEKSYSKSYNTRSDDTLTRSLNCTRFERKGATANFSLELMNSFLQERGSVIANGQVDADGNVSIDVSKFENLGTACIIIEDRHNCLCEIVPLGSKEPVKKDIRLEQSREANKVYLHERTVHHLKTGEQFHIKDLNNTEMTLVDNLGYLLEILKLISGKRDIDEWDFLKRWSSMESEDILKKYDRYISNELHIFAYFKDKEFFELVIKAHIQNKNEKSFVDHFLLDNKEELRRYLDPVNVHKLNIMEKALLIFALRDTDRSECEKLARLLGLFLDIQVEDAKVYNSLFDTVLKSEQSKEKGEDSVRDNRNTIATSFSRSSNRVNASLMPRNQQIANVQFDDDDEDFSIKENRGGVQSFRTMGITDEFVERNYFYSDAKSLEVTKFWIDFINHALFTPDKSFLSQNFILSARSNTELLAIAAVLDLPFEKEDNEHLNDQSGFHLTVKQNSIIFCKEIKERNDEKMDLDMILSQQFFDIYDRTERAKDGSNKLKKVTDFQVGKLYASRIAITNFSETQHEITLIAEVPQGSIPVKSQDYLKSTVITLEPLSTKTSEFLFYFPSPGEYSCYPAAITKDGCLIASSNISKILKVYRDLPKTELRSMKDILSVGKTDDILNFMRSQNIVDSNVFNFSDIYWLLKDKSFFDAVVQILEERFIFDETTYSFSVFHNDVSRMQTYLARKFQGKRVTIRELDVYYLKNGLFDIDDFKFREYYPLINPRVHDIGEYKHNILNRDFMNTYITFLKYLLDKGTLRSKDYFYLAIYFLLQDRVDDVLQIFPKILKDELAQEMLIQYEYLDAYLDLYTDYPAFKRAREICTRYLTYPIYTWRNKFIDLANQIAEFDGQVEIDKIITEDSAAKEAKKEAQKQIIFEASIAEGRLKVQSRNVVAYKVNLYEVDLEVMFSQDPFLEYDSDSFSFIKPNHSMQQSLPDNDDLQVNLVDIPEDFKNKNLLIQLICKDQIKSVTYFPTNLQSFVIENYGQIKLATADGKPLSKVYVKCFAKDHHGQVKFYKDGYTDMRGTFDYASLNLESQKNISMFALLILSKENGSTIQKVQPPTELQRAEGQAMQLKAEEWQKKQIEQAFDDVNYETEERKSLKEAVKESFKMKKNKYWK